MKTRCERVSKMQKRCDYKKAKTDDEIPKRK